MTEILDDFKEEKRKNYAKRSFRQFVIALVSLSIATGLFWYLVINKLGIKQQGVNSVFTLCFISFIIFTIRGFINSITSYRQKEPSSRIKKAAIIGNTILFCLFIGYFIYSYESFLKIFSTPIERVENFD